MQRIRFSRAFEGYIQDEAWPGGTSTGVPRHRLMGKILDRTEHRPWPLPDRPWVTAQTWHDLLFAHWPMDAALLRAQVPGALEIDTFCGAAWIGIVPFRMAGVRWRFTPPLPGLSAFPELNVRTYVTAEGKPGVWFFSLDAANAIAVAAARAAFHLPYFRARMSCQERGGWMHYDSERTHRGARTASLRGKYRPVGSVVEPTRGPLEHFLTERYCLYAAKSAGQILRGEIHHPAWQLQAAEAEFEKNTMMEAAGLPLPAGKPLLHFARRQDMVAWAPERVL
jgi:uncharacterized protein YqjF (DUF2071 family)